MYGQIYLYTNGPVFNIIAWLTVVIKIILTFFMTVNFVVPGLFSRMFSF